MRGAFGDVPSRIRARSVAIPEQSVSTIRRKSRRSDDDPASLMDELRPGALAAPCDAEVKWPGRPIARGIVEAVEPPAKVR